MIPGLISRAAPSPTSRGGDRMASPASRPAAIRRWIRLPTLLLLAPVGLLPTTVGGADPVPNPAVNWVLPLFTDLDGHRSMTLRGATVKPSGDSSVAVTDLNITIFSGDAAARVETVILSQEATFFPRENRAAGQGGVRVIKDEVEVTGGDWTYDHAGKKVSIRRDVRVVYRAALRPML
jgi:hypothetical protein